MKEHGEGWNSLVFCVGAKGHEARGEAADRPRPSEFSLFPYILKIIRSQWTIQTIYLDEFKDIELVALNRRWRKTD